MKRLTVVKVITAINVLAASGYAITGVINPSSILPPGASITQSTVIFALYAAARTIPLAIMVLASIIQNRLEAFITLSIFAGLMQLLDGFIGVFQGDLPKTIGPFILAGVQFAGLLLYAFAQKKKQS